MTRCLHAIVRRKPSVVHGKCLRHDDAVQEKTSHAVLLEMKDSTINYNKEAFLHPWNLTFLIVAMLGALALRSIPGVGDTFLSDVVLIFSAAFELLVLGVVPHNERFQRYIKMERVARARANPPTWKERCRALNKVNQRRHIKLRNLRDKIDANYNKLSYASQGLVESHIGKLDGLLDSCLALMSQHERYGQYSDGGERRSVELAIAELRREIEEDPDRVRAIKARRLKVLQQRQDRFKKSEENLEIIEAQLATIEDVVKYIHEQSITLRNPEEISYQLDVLLSEVEETEASVGEIEDVFATASDLLTGVDVFESPAESQQGEQAPAQSRRAEIRARPPSA